MLALASVSASRHNTLESYQQELGADAIAAFHETAGRETKHVLNGLCNQ
jgi:hypothetical protein